MASMISNCLDSIPSNRHTCTTDLKTGRIMHLLLTQADLHINKNDIR